MKGRGPYDMQVAVGWGCGAAQPTTHLRRHQQTTSAQRKQLTSKDATTDRVAETQLVQRLCSKAWLSLSTLGDEEVCAGLCGRECDCFDCSSNKDRAVTGFGCVSKPRLSNYKCAWQQRSPVWLWWP